MIFGVLFPSPLDCNLSEGRDSSLPQASPAPLAAHSLLLGESVGRMTLFCFYFYYFFNDPVLPTLDFCGLAPHFHPQRPFISAPFWKPFLSFDFGLNHTPELCPRMRVFIGMKSHPGSDVLAVLFGIQGNKNSSPRT